MKRPRKVRSDYSPANIDVLVLAGEEHARALKRELCRQLGIVNLSWEAKASNVVQNRLQQARLPDVIIVDWNAGGITGAEFARRVRRETEWPAKGLPIILTFERAMVTQLMEARDAGVDEYLVAPLTAAAMTSRLRAVLLRPRDFWELPTYAGPCRRRRAMAPDYRGHLRRLEDPIDIASANDREVAAAVEEIKGGLDRMTHAAAWMSTRDVKRMVIMHGAAQRILAACKRAHDAAIERVAAALVTYVEGMGLDGDVDKDVLQAVFNALNEMCSSVSVVSVERDNLAGALENLVVKKLVAV